MHILYLSDRSDNNFHHHHLLMFTKHKNQALKRFMPHTRLLIIFAFTSQLSWLNSYSKCDSPQLLLGEFKVEEEKRDGTEKREGRGLCQLALSCKQHRTTEMTRYDSVAWHVSSKTWGSPALVPRLQVMIPILVPRYSTTASLVLGIRIPTS